MDSQNVSEKERTDICNESNDGYDSWKMQNYVRRTFFSFSKQKKNDKSKDIEIEKKKKNELIYNNPVN